MAQFRFKEPLKLPNYPHGTENGTMGRHRRIYSELTVRQLLYNLIKREGNLSKAAEKIGVSKAFLSSVMRGQKAIGPKIASYFKFERHVIYVRRAPGAPLQGEAAMEWDESGQAVVELDVDSGEVAEDAADTTEG
jgi:hypothetical protein